MWLVQEISERKLRRAAFGISMEEFYSRDDSFILLQKLFLKRNRGAKANRHCHNSL